MAKPPGFTIRQWFQKHGSPVAAFSNAFVKAGRKYGIDPKYLAAIAMKETEGGLTGTGRPGQYNLTGIGGVGHMRSYPGYKAAIFDEARNLARPLYKGKSLAEQTAMWVSGGPPTASTAGYTRDIQTFLRQLGGGGGTSIAATPAQAAHVSRRNIQKQHQQGFSGLGDMSMLGNLVGQLSGVPELGAALQLLGGGQGQQGFSGLGGKGGHKGSKKGKRGVNTGVFNIGGGAVGFPTARRGTNLGGVSAHHERALGNWQSDNAIDVGVPIGTPIIAVANGRIGKIDTRPLDGGQFSGGSAYLMTGKNQFWYKHLKRVLVKPGQRVRKGQIIGYSGEGNGVPHLHFATIHGDPQRLIGL